MHAFSFGYLHLPQITRFFFSSAAFADVGDGSAMLLRDTGRLRCGEQRAVAFDEHVL